jgi:DNA primase
MDLRKTTDALNKIPIQQVAGWLGVALPKKGSARCPFPDHEDKNPSFEIKASGTRWICYGCNRKGGSIDFVKEYRQTDFMAAKQWLEAHDGRASAAFISRRVPKKKVEEPPKSDDARDSGEHSDVYTFLLTLCPLLESGKNYLLSRAITIETISVFQVAQMPRQSILPKLLNKFGFERIHAAGLLTKKSTIDDPRIIFPWNSVIFPFLENGKVVYLQARALEGAEQYGKWRNLNFQSRRIYNADAITQVSKRPFAICEGVIDALSAIELGYTAVGMMGVSAKFTPDQIRALRKKEVEILLDWDAPGEKRAQSLREELNQYGVVSIRKKLPSTMATDLNEYLKEKRGLV